MSPSFREALERQSGEMLDALVRASPVAVLAIDPERRVTLWNPAAERMFGWTSDEMLGQPYDRIIPEDQKVEFAGLFARVIGGEGFTGVEAPRLRKDGGLVPVGVSTAPLRDREGVVVGVMAILTDLTETRNLEKQLRSIERMESIGRLAGGVAHDFNNLLSVIQTSAELLRDEPDRSDRDELLGDVLEASARAADLTRQLLAFSRQQVLRAEPVEINEVVREAGAMLARLLDEDITLDLALNPAPLWVAVDRNQLHRVVMNLAVNAQDAMPRGGRLTIRTVQTGRSEVELSVSDTGTGVPPEVIPRMFEPFYTTKPPGEGTGLGLSMVHGFVHQSGGDVLVESEVGRGTTLRVRLPSSVAGAPRPVRRTATSGGARGPAATVLLVEDDEAVRHILLTLLRALGYATLEASGLAEAIAVSDAHEAPIHVLLTDLVMAGGSGAIVAEALRARRPSIRVVFMSGYAADEALRRGIQTSDAPFLQKPFTSAALDAAVRRALATPRPSAPLLLLHGWMADASVWADVLPALSALGPVIAPDLRGSTHAEQVEEALAALAAAGVTRAVVVGHSMGAQVALALAARAPDQVVSLVLLCPVPPSGLALPGPVAAAFRGAGGDLATLGYILDQACLALPAAAKERLVAAAARIPPDRIATQLDAWTAGLPGFDPSRVTAPVRVVGTDDPFLPTALLQAELVDRLPSARLEYLRGAGHYPQAERPDAVVALLVAP